MSAAEKQDIQSEDTKAEKSKGSKQKSGQNNVVELQFTAYAEIENMDPASLAAPSSDTSGPSEVAQVHHLPTASPHPVSNVEVDTLEAQVKLIALFSSEAKLLEAELNKLIKGAYSKAPEAKPYFLKMKKLLQMHADIEKILEKAKSVK
ncbi:MAG: hypothetical protein BM556_02475 [Bacteriovorax sp. MedPE-SWde]|nr:MAG: hypothetical protein BM556_02475 [Bacteriovorax sp. MedPE-SWde]